MKLRGTAVEQGVSCFKSGIPGYYEWIETHQKIDRAVKGMQLLREGLGPDIDIGSRFPREDQSQRGVDSREGSRAAEPAVRRRTVPAGERAGDGADRESVNYADRDGRTAGRALWLPRADRDGRGGYSSDRHQSCRRYHGVVESGADGGLSGISMAPHACEGPIGGLATVHVDAATPNFLVQEICSGVQPDTKEKVWEEWLGFPAMRMVNGRFPLPRSQDWDSR